MGDAAAGARGGGTLPEDVTTELALAEIRRFDVTRALEHARTPPKSWYTSPAVHVLERERVFARGWHAVGRTDQVDAPGRYFAATLAAEPMIVLRDADATLRALANVCSHHATQLLRGAGVCGEIVCPYHGWTYALNGRLLRAPGAGGMRHVARDTLDLRPYRTATLGPLVLVCLEPAPDAPGVSWAGALPPGMFATPSGPLRFVAQHRYEIACNWKVVVDNYLDGGYHVAKLHGGLAAGLALDSYRTALHARAAVQTVAARTDTIDRRLGAAAAYVWLYPALMLNRYGPILDMNRVVPLGPERTAIVFDYFFAPDAAEDAVFVAASLEASDRIQREDGEICERVQSGLSSRAYDTGVYAPRYEAGAHLFHRLLAAELMRD
jgi:choline monooxygenase